MDFTNWTKILKLQPRNVLPVVLFMGFILVAPIKWLDAFRITALVNDYRQYVAIIFLASCALLVSPIIFWISNIVKEKIANSRYLRAIQITGKDYLQGLTRDEINILKFYIINQTRTQVMDSRNGIVNGLVQVNIIYRSSRLSETNSLDFPYNIQPWAWNYLNSNKGLLDIHNMEKYDIG